MKLSIITINYNNIDGLKQTFESVFDQSSKDFEYIVIDGNSSDGSKELILQNTDQINYWVSESDNGIYNAMNKGIRAAHGEYLLFLNSGDKLYNKEVLSHILPTLYQDEIISGNLNIIEKDQRDWIWESPSDVNFHLFYSATLCHPCSFIKRSSFDKYGFYDESLKIVSDWKWFLLATCKYDATYRKIADTISTFYMDGLSSDPKNVAVVQQEKLDTMRMSFSRFYFDYQKLSDIKNRYKAFRGSMILMPYFFAMNVLRKMLGKQII